MDIYIPLIVAGLGIVSSIVSYFFGKKTAIDKARIDRGFTLAEEIAVIFQEVNELEKTLCTVYDMNFGDRSFEEAWDTLERLRGTYNQQFNQIRELSETREQLNEKLKPARVYLRKSVIDDIQKYIDLSLFRYNTDGGIMTDTFEREFFRNLVSDEKRRERSSLEKRIKTKLSKLIR
jgi:hypothetical protein